MRSASFTARKRAIWLLPPFGAFAAADTISSRSASGTGSGRNRRIARCVKIASPSVIDRREWSTALLIGGWSASRSYDRLQHLPMLRKSRSAPLRGQALGPAPCTRVQQPQPVEADDDRRPLMACDAEREGQRADEVPADEQNDHGGGDGQVRPDDTVRASGEPDHARKGVQLVPDDQRIGGLQGEV